MLNDISPFYLCCYGSYKSCQHYYDRRPNDNCAEWPRRPPPSILYYDNSPIMSFFSFQDDGLAIHTW